MIWKMTAGAAFGAVSTLYIVDRTLMVASLLLACVISEVAWRLFDRQR